MLKCPISNRYEVSSNKGRDSLTHTVLSWIFMNYAYHTRSIISNLLSVLRLLIELLSFSRFSLSWTARTPRSRSPRPWTRSSWGSRGRGSARRCRCTTVSLGYLWGFYAQSTAGVKARVLCIRYWGEGQSSDVFWGSYWLALISLSFSRAVWFCIAVERIPK